MESRRSSTTYFIPPGKFLLMENALGNPDLIQSSVSSDCRVTIVDLANFPLDELEQWPTFRLTSADIKLKLGNGAYYVYIVVPTPENMESTVAFISYNTALVDRDGYQVLESTDEKGNPKLEKGELLGKSGFKYYQCGTVSARGGNSSAITTPSGQGRTLAIDLGVNPQDSHLDKKVDWNFFYSLFVPHYDDPDDPEKLTWIEAKAHMGIAGGLTSFIDNGSLKLPSIYDGLPIDYQTLYWEEIKEEAGTDEEGNPIYKTTKVLKAAGGGGTGGGSANWDDIKAEISKNYVSSRGEKRTIWGQPLKGTDNITGDLTLGNTSKLIIPSFYDYNRFEVYANDEGVFIGVSDKQGGACANGNITIGGIKNDKFDWWLNSLKINGDTKINGDLILSADDDAKSSSKGAIYFGGDIYGASMSSEMEKQLSINAQNGVLINTGLITYNKKEGYFQFDGNIVVTGGLTTFADSGAGNQWIMDAETLEEVTSDNEFKVYSAKVTSMIAASISGATANATDAIKKLESIKTALSKLSSSSSASAIGSALKTLAGQL